MGPGVEEEGPAPRRGRWGSDKGGARGERTCGPRGGMQRAPAPRPPALDAYLGARPCGAAAAAAGRLRVRLGAAAPRTPAAARPSCRRRARARPRPSPPAAGRRAPPLPGDPRPRPRSPPPRAPLRARSPTRTPYPDPRPAPLPGLRSDPRPAFPSWGTLGPARGAVGSGGLLSKEEAGASLVTQEHVSARWGQS